MNYPGLKAAREGRTFLSALVTKTILPVLFLLLSFCQDVNATHFRYGTMEWNRSSTTSTAVTFRLNQVWRSDFPWGVPLTLGATIPNVGTLAFGDGTSALVSIVVTSINSSGNWFSGTATVNHTYPALGTYTANFSNCCRLSGLENNADQTFRVESTMNLSTALGNLASPVSTLLPIVFVPGNTTYSFHIPSVEPNGETVVYSLSTGAQMGGGSNVQPTGFSVNASTGMATFTTSGVTIGDLFNASVRITDSKGAATTVDFLMQIAAQVNIPYFDYAITPANNFTYNLQPGQPLTFNVNARDNDLGDVLTMASTALPSGALWAAQTGTNPANRVFTWTPTVAQLGSYIVGFQASDNTGATSLPTYVNIVVSLDPQFNVPPTPPASSQFCIPTGELYRAVISASTPNPQGTLGISAATIPGGNLFPTVPTALTAVSTSTTWEWTPSSANWGPQNVSFTATDNLGNATTHGFTVVVNTSPVFTSTQASTTIAVGQTFTYNISASDPDVPFGDVLDILEGAIPSWLTFTDNGDGTALLTGTPGIADLGTAHIHLHAEDIYHHCGTHTSQLFNITVVDPADVQFSVVNSCAGANTGSVTALVTGGTAPYSYAWSSNATDVSDEDGASIYGLAPGTYTVTVTDASIVETIASVTVGTVTSNFATSGDVAICAGGSTTITAGGADLYLWSTGATTASITVSPANTTPYTVTGYISTDNLVSNGDFSAGNTGFSSSYAYVAPGGSLVPESDYAVDVNANAYHGAFFGHDHTTGTGNFMIINGSGTPNTQVWGQTVNNVIPNTTYYFSTWVTSVNPGSPAQLNFSINGNPLGPVFAAPAGVTGTWVQFYQTWFSGSATSANISIVNQNTTLGGNDFGLDDISFTTVCPEVKTVTVTVNPVPTADAGADRTICEGTSTDLTATGAGVGGSYLWSNGETTATITVSPASTTTYNVTVTTAAGCISVGDVTVTVGDFTLPTPVCQSITVQLDATGNVSIAAADIDGGSSDNCGQVTLSASATSFTCANIGANTVTLTVTDAAGNSADCDAVVTVEDNVAPVATCKNITVTLDADGNATIEGADVDNGSYDVCGSVSLSVSPTSFSCENKGDNPVVLTVTDAYGNTATCNATVNVIDNTAPSAVCQNVTVTLVNGVATVSADDVNNGSTDNCGVANLSLSNTSFNCSDIGNNTVELTVTDEAGNSSSCTATVTVVGVTPSCSIASIPGTGPATGANSTTIYLGYGPQTTKLQSTVTGGGPFTYSWIGSGLSCTNCAAPVFTPTAEGNYTFTLTVTNSFGCTTTCFIEICVLDVTVPGSKGKKVYVCHRPPGNPNNVQTLSISVNAVSAHVPFHGGDNLGRCDQSCGSDKWEGETGELLTDYTGEGFDLIVFPNPFQNQFRITVESESTEPVNIRVYDVTGQLVLQSLNRSANEEIWISDSQFAKGIYLARVQQGENQQVVRVIKN
jgi:hypothetical protein